jgi:hypothetical protein
MAWLNPGAWAGLALLAGPVAVHLLLRHRAERVLFPSLRFVSASRTAAVRLRRPSDLLLLVLRLATVGLAVVALAQPLLLAPARVAAWNVRLAKAVVVDVSDSMKPLMASAAQAADEEARSTAFTFRIEAEDLATGFRKAVAALRKAPQARREIVVISDFQSGVLRRADIAQVPLETGLRFVQVGHAQSERLVQGLDVLGVERSAQQQFVLSAQTTRLHALVVGPETEGLALLTAPSDAGTVHALRRAVAAAGTPAPSPHQPVAVAFAGAPLPQSVRVPDAGWMLETVLRLKNDREIADACNEIDAVTRPPGEGAWYPLFRDRQGRTLVRVAASDSTLLVDVAAPPAAFAAAAVVRGVLVARRGVTARPEDEVRRMSSAELAGLARPPGAVNQNHPGQTSDARWCWVLVLVLLTVEIAARGRRNAAAEEARPDAA